MHKSLPLVAVTLALFTSAAPSVHASPISVSSSLNLIGRATIGVTDVVTDTASQGTTLNPLSAHISGGDSIAGELLGMQASALATWSSAAAGQLTFTDMGWISIGVFSGAVDLRDGSDWTYTFTTTNAGSFDVAWDVGQDSRTNDASGLVGFRLTITNGGVTTQAMPIDTAGNFSQPLLGNTTYTVQIENLASVFGGLGTRTALMDATFDWTIAEATDPRVPEPSTIVLLGLCAVVARHRRKMNR